MTTRDRKNRAMLLTAPGASAIAVVRLAGPGVGEFLRRHFSRDAVPGRCTHGNLLDAGRIVDDPVVVLSPEADFADVSLHGGPWVVQSVLDLAQREGFEVVNPRVPLDEIGVDGNSLIEREMLAHLPLARTELALRALLAQPEAWIRTIAAGIDPETFRRILQDRSLIWLLHPPRVAILGVPNVGKSTIANQLFASERSIIADLPGTTRDWVGELANLDGLAVMLVDTPGVRQSDDPIESQAIQRSAQQIAAADLLVLVLDQTQPRECQLELLRRYQDQQPLLVINKCDSAPAWDPSALNGIRTIASTGQGIDELRTAIRRRFADDLDPQRPRIWTDRQREVLEQALSDPGALQHFLNEDS